MIVWPSVRLAYVRTWIPAVVPQANPLKSKHSVYWNTSHLLSMWEARGRRDQGNPGSWGKPISVTKGQVVSHPRARHRHSGVGLGPLASSSASGCLCRSTQIKTYSWDNAQVLLVGNKCDMEDERVVSSERGRQLADHLGEYRGRWPSPGWTRDPDT